MIVLTWSRPSDVVKLRFFYRWKLVKWGWAAPRSFILTVNPTHRGQCLRLLGVEICWMT